MARTIALVTDRKSFIYWLVMQTKAGSLTVDLLCEAYMIRSSQSTYALRMFALLVTLAVAVTLQTVVLTFDSALHGRR